MVRNLSNLLSLVTHKSQAVETIVADRDQCLVCETALVDSEEFAIYRVCPNCRFHYSMTARERIESVVDHASFKETNRSLVSMDPLSFSTRISYKERIVRDQRRTGLTEAAVTGTCSIGGAMTILIVLDFGFMGGTMGCVVGEKVSLALELATKRRIPAVAIVTSGGARIQEGILSLMQMAKSSIAACKLDERGLPFISVLANPTTGQTFASFANLADIILAEPGAIVGFSPIRDVQPQLASARSVWSHTAEYHLKHGMLDAIIDRTQLRNRLAVLLDLLGPQHKLAAAPIRRHRISGTPQTEAWGTVQLARHMERPTSIDYVRSILDDFVELHGDRFHSDDPAIICGLGQLGTQTVSVVCQERGKSDQFIDRRDGRTSPEGFRKAQRAIRFAQKFDIPLLTFIDTPGVNLTIEAEGRGLGNTIANTIASMATTQVPSIAIVIGEGGSGCALALGVADRVLMLENAIYSAISPEAAAELIYQDESKADEAAKSLRLTAHDCVELGIVDVIVQEPRGGAHKDPREAARLLRRELLVQVSELQNISKRKLLRERYKKFRNIGEYSSYFKSAISNEVNTLQSLVANSVRKISRRSRKHPIE